VWDLVGPRFDRILEWATTVAASAPIAPTPLTTAPSRCPPRPSPVDRPGAGLPHRHPAATTSDRDDRDLRRGPRSDLPGQRRARVPGYRLQHLDRRPPRRITRSGHLAGPVRHPRSDRRPDPLGDLHPGRAQQPASGRRSAALPRRRHTLTAQAETAPPHLTMTDTACGDPFRQTGPAPRCSWTTTASPSGRVTSAADRRRRCGPVPPICRVRRRRGLPRPRGSSRASVGR
jgi:hypothetical protein